VPQRLGEPPTPRSGPDRAVGDRGSESPDPKARHDEPFLITGSDCTGGHEPGRELQAGPIGTLPTRRTAMIGFGLVLWGSIGLAIILDPRWVGTAVLLLGSWLLFSAVVQRRLGHRGRCWRTRAWRQAWGGLVPGRD